MKKIVYLTLVFGLFGLNSCIDDDDGGSTQPFPEEDRGSIEVNRIIFTVTSPSIMGARSFEYYDADGFNSGNPPTINEKIEFETAGGGGVSDYESSMRLFKDDVEVTNDIKNLGTKYIICYRDLNRNRVRTKDQNLDGNGKILGTEVEWSILDDKGDGTIRVTLNYLPARKEGICDAGFRIFESVLNYQNK